MAHRWVSESSSRGEPRGRPSLSTSLLAAFALAVIVLIVTLPPHSLLDKADRAAFAVCHRIPERTLTIAGRPLPLCARCSGSHLGALMALGIMAIRGCLNAGKLPQRRYLLLLGAFVAVWAVDGLNSYLTLFPGIPHLYEPSNSLRLVTGILQGITLAVVLLPLANRSLARRVGPQSSVRGVVDMLWLLAGAALLFWLLTTDRAVLLYPLAIISGLAVLALAALLNLLILSGLFERSGISPTGLKPALICIALAASELAAVGVARAAFEARFGLPF